MSTSDVIPIRLRLPGIKVTKLLRDDTEALEVAVETICASIRCKDCGHKTRTVHQVTPTRVRDLPVLGRRTTLVWARRRFRCGSCGATTTESHPQLDGHLTIRLRRELVAEVVDSTVAAVARRHDLSWYQVMAVVLASATVLFWRRRHEHTRVLMIDEKALVKGHNGFSTIVSDGESGKVIAVLEGRSEAVLAEFFATQSARWCAGVAIVCTDMANCYRAAIRSWLPKATHVADRFHILHNFMALLVEARRAAQATPAGEPHDPVVFKARFALMTRMDRLSAEQATQLTEVFATHPHLEAVWELTQRFHRIYEARGADAGYEAIVEFCDAAERTLVDLGSTLRTLWRWRECWMGFHTSGRWTNAVAEGINAKIEVLERKAYGFRTQANHEARIVIECSGHRRKNRPAA
ncbi:MAG: ISL3 family transposase [Acidimicrobiales bacterium]